MPQQPKHDTIQENDENAKRSYKHHYDRRHGVRQLPNLQDGQPVLIRREGEDRWIKPGIIRQSDHDNRTYMVETPTGMLRRNRVHIQPVPSIPRWHYEDQDYLEDQQQQAMPAPGIAVPAAAPAAAPVAVPAAAPHMAPAIAPNMAPAMSPVQRRSVRPSVRTRRLIEEV